jgi:hypothetical protein
MVETSRRDVTRRVESLAAINSQLLNALVEDNAGERSIRNTTLLLGIALELDEVSNSLARLMRVAGPGAGDSFEPRSVSNG